jgi:TolB-like protein/Tfp pilus assembly protein PilF/tRNA A-37 threonylcarbamoyl transferase component Bud32
VLGIADKVVKKQLDTSVADGIENPTKCPQCGAITGVDDGTCINCLLREGLEAKGEASREAFESILTEADVTDTHWRLGHYEILEEIGRGGMGVIYRARQQHSRRVVAVKRILAHQVNSHEALVRFRREAEAVASLDHPNILPIHEVSESEEGLPFFSMKYATGGSLRTAAPALRTKPRECVRLMAKVARGIAYAHSKGVLHRDLQPGNILLDENGEPMVSDFGLAKWLDQNSELTRTLETLGTPGYIAPEQTECPAAELTNAADVYSLGAIGFYLLTGRPPFVGPNVLSVIHQAATTPAPRLRSLAPSFDRDLETIVAGCLESDPNARYQSAGALADDLEHWLRHEPIQARRTGIFTLGRKWMRRNPTSALLAASLIAMAAAAGWIVWKSEFIRHSVTNGVAVLPFENLSHDPDNAYFANGIQEEILTRLASIAGLKVISRTSTQQYQSKPRNLREIAEQLGVANIVEGSVQKAADQVRVNVQLINAQTDSHLWAETYDRKLTEIFSIESDIAKDIADALQVKLTTGEKQALAVKPTNNPEAYDLYLRGLSFEARFSAAWQAVDFYEQAVKLDPNFAIAWARLSRADADIYSDLRDTAPGRRDAAKRALENAQKLQPNSPETLLALGYYQYRVLSDYGAAKITFGRVSKLLPASTEVPYALAEVARREGHWDQSIAYYEQALALDPRDVELLREAALTYSIVRRFPAALKLYDRALDITPNDPELMASKARIYQFQGNLQEAARFLSEINWRTAHEDTLKTKLVQLRLERNYGEAIGLLQARLAQFHFPSQFAKAREQVALAFMQRLAGDMAGAKATAEHARNTLELVCKNQPDNASAWAMLAGANALIGERDLALKQMTRSMTLLPSAKDPMLGPALEGSLPIIQTIFGETSRPISTLARLLQTPSFAPLTPAFLRLDPFWDPLRTDPVFQKLCEEKQLLESPRPLPAGIAVLPFENLSADPENAFFTDGVQDEILNDLAKIADLKVISRTSVMQYKSGGKRNLRQIANELGVAHMVEGSVQRAANRVRVSARLIDAKTDTHLWVNSYDRPLDDVFAIQSEIAKDIADALQVKLTTGEKQALAVKPTNNREAYDAYLRGLSFEARSTSLWEAVGFYERAVQLDPNFALAWARLSRAHANIYSDQRDTTPGRRDAANRALENAQKLQPNSPETLLTLGYYQYRVLRDYGAAKTTFGHVSKMLPASTEVPYALAEVARREGNWDQSIAYYEQALALDPRNVELLREAALTYSIVRQFSAALKLYDRALDITPNDSGLMAWKARIYQAQGNLQEADRFLSEINARTAHEDAVTTKLNQLRLERNYGEAIGLLQARLAQFHFSSQFGKVREQVTLAWMQRLAGDTAGAKATAEQARNTLESVCKNQPDNAFACATLARANALIGERDLALKQITRSMTLLPSAEDPMLGPTLELTLPLIQTIFGETSRPISTLARLLKTPSVWPLTPALLRLDPVWDPLRTDPAFQKLCEEKQPPATP